MATCQELTDSHLECAICGDVYTKPTSVTCGHTLCFECLVAYAQSNPETTKRKAIPCPFCRQWNEVPGGTAGLPVKSWVEKFKTNITLQHIVDSFHQRKKPTQGPGVCSEHPDQKLQLFCTKCLKPVCLVCETTTHRTCYKVVPLSQMQESIIPVAASDKENLNSAISTVKGRVIFTENTLVSFLTECKKTEHGIRDAASVLRDMISKRESMLVKELRNFKAEHEREMRAVIASGRSVVQLTQVTANKTINKTNPSLEVYDDFKALTLETSAARRNLQAWTKHNNISTPVTDWKSNLTVPKQFEKLNLGELNLSLLPSAYLRECITETCLYDTLLDIDVVVVNSVDVAVVSVYDAEFCLRSISFSSHPRLQDGLTDEIKHTFCQCWVVSKLPPGRIMVNWKGMKEILIVDVKPELSISKTISTKKEYMSLAALSPDTIVAGTDTPPSVDILDISGTILKYFDNNSIGRDIFSSPFYISVNHDKNVLVSDCGTKTLTCLSTNGSVLFRYPPSGMADMSLQCPHGVAVDKEGSIFVVDHKMHTVIQLTKTGKFVREVVGADVLKNPHGICFDSKGNMIVTQTSEVLIFEFR